MSDNMVLMLFSPFNRHFLDSFESSHMTDLATATKPKRPAWVSILHRASGAIMFLLMPFIIWMFDASVSSEISFARFTSVFNAGVGFVPGWFFKLVALALIWAYLQHFIAGLRHLFMDLNHDRATKEFGKSSAMVVLVLSLGLTFILALKLFGAY
jgi:succinate dehydrogenase / fumarate reductase, cytochrome b subunit